MGKIIQGLLVFILICFGTSRVEGAVSGNPTSVNVSTSGSSTFVVRFLETTPGSTFTTTLARFCTTTTCLAGTVLGRLPANLDRGSTSTPTTTITDVVTVPYSILRVAISRNLGVIQFVRTFQEFPGGTVTVATRVRLTGGIASAPLSLTRVDIFGTETGRPRVRFITLGDDNLDDGVIKAEVRYVGTGLLTGWWEVRAPNDLRVRELDRFTEGSLSQTEREQQRRFRRIKRIRVQLPASGRIDIAGPRYAELPRSVPGPHEILLHIEVTRDPKARSTLTIAGQRTEYFTGASAAFPLPALRYRVGTMIGRLGHHPLVVSLARERGIDGRMQSFLTWTPIKIRGLVVELHVTDKKNGDEHKLLAPVSKGLAKLPPAWLGQRPLSEFSFGVKILGPDRKPIGNMREVRISPTALKK